MTLKALGTGYLLVRSNLRLVLLAWALNAAMALLVAVPFLNQLDSYIAPTANEEQLLLRFDENWYRTYQFDMRASPYARLLDYSTLGAAPFVHHLDGMLSGGAVRAVGGFIWNAATTFRIQPGQLDMLALLALGYSLIGILLSGGFIGAFAGRMRVSVAEFTAKGARYFGRFFRVSLVGFIAMYLLFVVLGKWLGDLISLTTANDASEWTAFILTLGKNVVLLVLVWLLGIVLDYAKVRIVLEDRTGAVDAVRASLSFIGHHAGAVVRLSLVFVVLTLALMAIYALVVAHVHQTTYAMIALMVVVQQAIVAGRMCVKAGTYASEVALLRLAFPEDHGEPLQN